MKKRIRNNDREAEHHIRVERRKKGLCRNCGLPAGTWFVRTTGEIRPRYRCVECSEREFQKIRERRMKNE